MLTPYTEDLFDCLILPYAFESASLRIRKSRPEKGKKG